MDIFWSSGREKHMSGSRVYGSLGLTVQGFGVQGHLSRV